MLTIGITLSNEDDGIAFVNRSESVYDVAMSDDDRVAAKVAASEWLSAGIDINWLGYHAGSGHIGD